MVQFVKEQNNKRIAKNSAILYLRTAFTMLVGFFTCRVVLEHLGVQEYGIYNVVGGITSMFVFLNSTMSVSTSRFITYELGIGNKDRLRTIYSQAKIIHYIIAVIIFILIETVGLWLVCNKLTIPPNRLQAAIYTLHTVSIGTILGIISTPDTALVISHERMSAFAYITMMDSVLRLIAAYMITIITGDKLIWYALLMLIVFGIDRICYLLYCKLNFPESKGKIVYDRKTFQSMLSFAGWNILGNMAAMTREQGITIIINIFTNPIVNAARAITAQVSNSIAAFVYNVRTAVNPQITKSYAAGDYTYMHKLIVFSSLSCFFILLILSIPLICIADTILSIWLVEVPAYSTSFFRLTLVGMLVYSLSNPLIIGVHATGRIKKFQIIEGILLLTTLPLTYFFLCIGCEPTYAYIAIIISNILTLCGDVVIILPNINYPITKYLKEVILPALRVVLLSSFTPTILIVFQNILHFPHYQLFIAAMSFLSTSTIVYFWGLSYQQRQQVISLMKRKVHK